MTTLCGINKKRLHGENDEGTKPSVHVEHARCGRSASEKEKPWAEPLRRAVGDDAVVLCGTGQGTVIDTIKQLRFRYLRVERERATLPEGDMRSRAQE